jgi:tRNA(Ile)-lysidine synthase
MKTYIVAVSGGLDSVTLLHLLVSGFNYENKKIELKKLSDNSNFIVAHINHGIRIDSNRTESFVKELANNYGVQFVSAKLKLKGRGEAESRDERYKHLLAIQKKYKANAIITAHNLNDKLETAIINYIRGTGWRGYCSLNSTDKIIRPLLNLSRGEITKIAARANLIWHEDSTNSDESYLRNKIRKSILPKFSKDQIEQLSLIVNNLELIKKDVDRIFKESIENGDEGFSLLRSQIASQNFSKKMLAEVLTYILPKLGATYDKKVVASLSEFCLSCC